MNSEKEGPGRASCPVVGARQVAAAAAAPYHARWRVLDASGQPVDTGEPGLADVSVELRFGYLVLRAPGMLRLDIPLEVIEDDPTVLRSIAVAGESLTVADEGDWAAEWFSRVLGRPARLVKVCGEAVSG